MRIRVYANLRELVDAKTIELEAGDTTTVRRVLQQASEAYPRLGEKLWDGNHHLNKSIQVLVNGRSIDFLHGLDTVACSGDTVDLFPPVGGG